MKEQLEYYIRANLKNPKEEEIKDILDIFQLKKLEKGEIFKDHRKVCRNLGFIVEGSLRHFAVKKNGNEVTGRISQKNDFVTDIISVQTKAETPITIEALEPTSILVTSIQDMNNLLEINLTFNRLLREYMADNVVEMGKMHIFFLTGTAKDRYQLILEKNPKLLKNIPLRFIATMIGITPTQLSRIRNRKDRK